MRVVVLLAALLIGAPSALAASPEQRKAATVLGLMTYVAKNCLEHVAGRPKVEFTLPEGFDTAFPDAEAVLQASYRQAAERSAAEGADVYCAAMLRLEPFAQLIRAGHYRAKAF